MDFTTLACISIFGILISAHYGDAVRLTIQPNPVTVGGTDPAVPTTTPQELVIECTPDGTGNFAGAFSFYLRRNNILFAEINNIDNNPKISDNAPTDIRNKNPTVEGSVQLSNSLLRVRFLVSRLTCQDQETYTCEMNYKPSIGETAKASDEERLTMTILPGNLQITVFRTVNNFPQQIQNQSTVQYNDDLEYRCTGSIGTSSNTLLEWYKLDHLSGMFGKFVPAGIGESIDDGQPSVSVCPYTRTSTLRYRVTTANRNYIVFRCQVSAQQSNGALHTAYSHEYTVTPPLIGVSSRAAFLGSHFTSVMIAAVFGLAFIFTVT